MNASTFLRTGAVALCALLLAGCAGLRLPSFRFGAPAVDPMPPGVALQWGDKPGQLPAAAKDPGYLIGPEDALEIAVWKDETLKSTTVVRPDGAVSFPLVGELAVAGRTVGQVREEIVRRLEKFIPEPVVSVSVARVASYRFYVLGRVNKPGEFVAGRSVDVLQALSLAGGVTPFAVEDEIRIIRRSGGTSTSIPFDYSRVRKAGDLRQNITLLSGDVLFVP
jgi:polysaccharide biosynthesis/export protein